MLQYVVFLTVLATALACAPGGEPAYIALFTEEIYTSANDALYKQQATKILTDALAKHGITYDPSWVTIGARPSFNRVVIDVYIRGGVDCKTLPDFVKDMIQANVLVSGAGMRCGTNPDVNYVNNDTRQGKNSPKKSL
ncbi:hypothetical protein Y032_0013g2166 [Ancylostoma ceylanicum]|uniref:Uncharacterized protein n=1 Tax=Ancylostoma ceylanicum TaxID=53326 RepID=A0A016VCW3_9BILA|nr:hypothetical protein Y032_0013g2166 [Ancylostoma ceylanicum]